jgi:hypothetical protein
MEISHSGAGEEKTCRKEKKSCAGFFHIIAPAWFLIANPDKTPVARTANIQYRTAPVTYRCVSHHSDHQGVCPDRHFAVSHHMGGNIFGFEFLPVNGSVSHQVDLNTLRVSPQGNCAGTRHVRAQGFDA